jgi:bidirectional [NiFe] hydrogenase diaphorase subunit
MVRILERITKGSSTRTDLETLKELCTMVRETSLCGLGQSAPNPVLSTMRYFFDEYEAHIQDRRCSAGVCSLDEVPIYAPAVALDMQQGNAGRSAGSAARTVEEVA